MSTWVATDMAQALARAEEAVMSLLVSPLPVGAICAVLQREHPTVYFPKLLRSMVRNNRIFFASYRNCMCYSATHPGTWSGAKSRA